MTMSWDLSDTHTHTQSWSELECDTDFLGTTGRREVQLAHKQEMAGATTQWGFLFTPSPPHDSLLFTRSPLPLIIQNPRSHPALSSDLHPSNLSSYSSLHILLSSLLTHPILTFKLCQKLKWKQEVINQRSVPFKRKTNLPWCALFQLNPIFGVQSNICAANTSRKI